MNRRRVEMFVRLLSDWQAAILTNKDVEQFDISVIRSEKSCGTTACALGYLGVLPEVTKQGFNLARGFCFEPTFQDRRGCAAAAMFLDIRLPHADRIFYAADDTPLSQVIEDLQELLDAHDPNNVYHWSDY